MLAVRNLTYTYDNTITLRYPDFSCARKESLLITGRSGCGKTTLLHILGGLINDYKGEVSIDDLLINGQRTQLQNRKMGIIFQHSHFIKGLTVRDNILVAVKRDKYKFLPILSKDLGIAHLLNKSPLQLSQGEKQRVGIARALIGHPMVLLADEPTSSLDDENTEAVLSLLREQATRYHSALIIVSHDDRIKKALNNHIELT
jgi:ABC-type lipoprotein export system ATPase subunit